MHNAIELPDIALTELATWARRAEAAGYEAIVAPDQPGAEPLVALAAVAAATERIELITTLEMRPERTTALLAKQAATVDVLSGGRLTVGIDVSDAASAPPMHSAEELLEMHVDALRHLWPGRVVAGPASLEAALAVAA